jgi:hypothetical protein
MKAPVSTAVAIAFGWIVLVGYLLPGLLGESIQAILLQAAVVLAAFALLAGVINLLRVHSNKLKTEQPGNGYSVFVLLGFLIVVIAVAADFVLTFQPLEYWSLLVFKSIQVPVESSLLAVLAVVLAYAGARLLHRRTNAFAIIFVFTVLIVLLGTTPFFLLGDQVPVLSDTLGYIRGWITQVFATGGARGLLLGVALGTVATGLRILMGSDRPYGG